MDSKETFHSSPDKGRLAQRSAALWTLLQDDSRFAYYGRLVALSDPGPDAVAVLCAMAKVQGAAVAYFVPVNDATPLFASLQAQGLSTDRHEQLWGGESALDASRQAMARYPMPSDLSVHAINVDTPAQLVREVAELCESCDVMPVGGAVMRGLVRAGICLVALDRKGRAVATASSYTIHHPSSPHATDVFWGMLATHADRRGEKIGLLLGAQAIIHMWENQGARGFMTGVRADNPSSQALCEKLGVGRTGWVYVSCMDRELFGGGSITR